MTATKATGKAPAWMRHRAAATRSTLAVEMTTRRLRARLRREGRLTADVGRDLAAIIAAVLAAEARVDAIRLPVGGAR